MKLSVNLGEVEQLVNSDEFTQFLLSHSTELATSAFILQTLFDAIENAQSKVEE